MIDEPFIRSIGIIIIAAAVFALGARVVAMPSIIAYLAAGIFLGPLTGFIEVSEAIHLIAETGIALLLFLVGLELSFERVRGVGYVAGVAGGTQILLTVVGGFGLCFVLGYPPVTSLVVGIALTFSSTVIVVKLLVDRDATSKPFGQIAIGILLVQDLFVVILLTLLSGMQESGSLEMGAVAGGLARAFLGMAVLLAAVLAAAKWLLRRSFAWAAGSPETVFIWSLCWCFLVVAATHFLHLSPEIGAFVAGVSLAQLPHNEDLQRRVLPLMNFFIAIFFVSLGLEMGLDAPLAFWGKAAVLAGFVVVGKFTIVMWIVARLRHEEKTAYYSALLLTQVSEFSFIFMALSVEAGLVEGEVAGLLGLVGLLSITVSTVAIVFRQWLYEAAVRSGLMKIFGADEGEWKERGGAAGGKEEEEEMAGHVIIVGMNSLGRELAKRLRAAGEEVLAIDLDPGKLASFPGKTLLGDAESGPVLREAGLKRAKLLVSTLHIESTNDLLAYRCRRMGVPCSIHAFDLNALDNLLEMDVKYLIVPKTDGVKRQQRELERLGFLEA